MIHFIIYDDSNKFKKIITDTINKIMFKKDEPYKIDYFNENINSLPQEKNIIYIIDIDSLNENAFLIADKIRNKDIENFLIFNTNHLNKWSTKILKGHFLFHSILNNNTINSDLSFVIDFLLKKKNKEKVLSLKSRNVIYKIYINDIIYVTNEKMTRNILIETNYNTISIPGTLRQFYEMVDDRFMYSHRSCLVNTERISTIDKQKRTITFDNGIVLDLLSFRSIKHMENKIYCNNS